uniref:Kinesinlike protein putative n=1 Tax=Albugo laibachii Nc14 TaxID=890382 RepID=F0WX05_9STRA|nr:kinesinlike protein putative [Albugo laibachii Nc14]|eukprot:CCA25993.1 kinesinlike protein putative [Albugo laibachii Nc14]
MIIGFQRDEKTPTSKSGRPYLVDLAGSEMVRKTEASGRRLEEAKTINRSLSTLGQVIKNMADLTRSYVSYQDSKLTKLLQHSISGNSATCLVVHVSRNKLDSAETFSTLRFGSRANQIKNSAKINTSVSKKPGDFMDLVQKLEKDLKAEKHRVSNLVSRDHCSKLAELEEELLLVQLKSEGRVEGFRV